ncbi:MAG: nitroreductase family protein [Bacillaceae bacterium]
MSTVTGIIEARRSVKAYDKNAKISKEELIDILELANRAPSAWNLQHWHFKVFHSDEGKQALLPIAYNQSQITEASAVIAVLGDLEAYKKVDAVFASSIEAGMMTEEIKNRLASQIHNRYSQNDHFPLHAACTNASLAAMQLMLIAKERGYDTCAIGGFNANAFKETFHISDRYVPVMLITIGKAAQPGRKTDRLPIEAFTSWE